MAFKLVVSNTVSVPVKGVLTDAQGRAEPFAFQLVCKRLGAADLARAVDARDKAVGEFLAEVVQGWSGVNDGDANAITYSDEALRQLLDVPGLAVLAFQAYLREVGAREKN